MSSKSRKYKFPPPYHINYLKSASTPRTPNIFAEVFFLSQKIELSLGL